jgi:hypothetical protein
MKNIVILVVLSGFLWAPWVHAYPPNPKNCCVYCPHDGQELCFWNDKNFLYMSIEPDDIGRFCTDVLVNQSKIEYAVKGYSELDDFICKEIDAYVEVRFADTPYGSRSPFNPTRPLTVIIEHCKTYGDNRIVTYPSGCGVDPTSTSTMPRTTTTTTPPSTSTTTSLPTTTTTSLPTTTTTSLPTTTTTSLPTTTTTSLPTTTTTSLPTTITTSLPTTTTTSVPERYSISGYITGEVIADISVKLTGKASKIITPNEKGYYAFSGLAGGNYTITPHGEECELAPHNYLIQNLTSDLSNMNFIAAKAEEAPCPPTAICGDDPEETELLRYLRDNVLRNTKEGQELIEQWKKMKEINKGKENLTSDLSNMNSIAAKAKEAPCPPTAICGEDPEEIELLRYLRDNVLRNTTEGQELIKQWKKVKEIKKGEGNNR